MAQHNRPAVRVTALAIGALLIVNVAFAQEQSIVIQPEAAPPVLQPATSERGPAAQTETIPSPTSAAAVVHPAPPITHHAGPRARRMLACNEQVELVMIAKNPVDCRLYEIPLCVPACCEGQPAMREGRGIFGRGIVEYCWPCGFIAKVKFRPVHCDVKVEYSVD